MRTNSEEAHARAELRFKKSQKAATARAQAVAEYVSIGERRRKLSEKLKALRLAQEAEELAASDALPPKKRPARKTAKK